MIFAFLIPTLLYASDKREDMHLYIPSDVQFMMDKESFSFYNLSYEPYAIWWDGNTLKYFLEDDFYRHIYSYDVANETLYKNIYSDTESKTVKAPDEIRSFVEKSIYQVIINPVSSDYIGKKNYIFDIAFSDILDKFSNLSIKRNLSLRLLFSSQEMSSDCAIKEIQLYDKTGILCNTVIADGLGPFIDLIIPLNSTNFAIYSQLQTTKFTEKYLKYLPDGAGATGLDVAPENAIILYDSESVNFYRILPPYKGECLTISADNITFSNDGKYMAMVFDRYCGANAAFGRTRGEYGELWLYDIVMKKYQKLYPIKSNDKNKIIKLYNSSFSPDMKYLAFTAYQPRSKKREMIILGLNISK